MTTAVAASEDTAVTEPEVLEGEERQQTLAEQAEFLQENCYTVDFEVSWFGKQRKVSGAEKQAMLKRQAADEEADIEQLSVSLSIFAKGDEDIKALEDAKRALYAYRDSMTIPSAKLAPTEMTRSGERKLVRKQAGERIIMSGDVDTFDDYVSNVLIPNLQRAVRDANARMLQIRQRAKDANKKRFNENEFPEEFTCFVTGPDYRQVGLSVDFEESCPRAAERLKAKAEKRLADTVELAVGDFANSFMEACALAAQQLSHRTRLAPPSSSDYVHLDGAEVLEIFHPSDDETLEPGQISLQVRYVPAGKEKSVIETVGPMTERDYQRLNPMKVEERRKVFQSTFEHLLDDLERFRQIRNMLGDMAAPLDDIVQRVHETLSQVGSTAHAVTNNVKESDLVRNMTARVMADAAGAIEAVVDMLPVKKARRRRAIGKL